MKKKIFTILILTLFFIFALNSLFIKKTDELKVKDIISPAEIVLENNKTVKIKDFENFNDKYTVQNKLIASKLNMTEDEAFIYGNFGKYWAKNFLMGKKVKFYKDDIVYFKFKYSKKLENSPFCFKNGKPMNEYAFNKELNMIRRGNFILLDLDNEKYYPISKENAEKIKNYIIVRKNHIKKSVIESKDAFNTKSSNNYSSNIDLGFIKILVSDMTTKLIPDRNCSSDICREILTNINNSKKSIDIAIYGYSSTPEIENAIKSAIKRGVKVRLVYDLDADGNNIYPNTSDLVKIIPNNKSDKNSQESASTMHNKFYVFDGKTVITGSANLSHTDMSGYNSNSIIVINSEKISKIYEKEFEQMYEGRFHNNKIIDEKDETDGIKVYFSPQDRAITNGVLPALRGAKKYIYIPAFIITEKRVTEELIKAKNRGVDVKIIVDSLNASNKYSKHKVFRAAEIPVKAENYAGKMHSKTIIIDDEILIIGSMNFSRSGEFKNDENLIILKNPKAAEFYRKFFLYQWSRIPDKWLKYTPRAEGIDSIGSCTDGIDNNYDGYTDLNDTACLPK